MTKACSLLPVVLPAAVLPVVLSACARVAVDPIEVKPIPIHVTMDVNIRIDRELDRFFQFEEKIAPPTQPGPAEMPAPAPAPAPEAPTTVPAA